MATPDRMELWPTTWKETRKKAEGIMEQLQGKLAEKPLEAADLEVLNGVIDHMRSAWERPWRNPVLTRGVGLIRSHFARAFSLEPTLRPKMQYRRILEVTLPNRYFERMEPDNPEVQAMAKVMTFHNSLVKE